MFRVSPSLSSSAAGRGLILRHNLYAGFTEIELTTANLALICLRGKFEVKDPAQVKSCRLSLEYLGGVVVYVNGKEARKGVKGPHLVHAVSAKAGRAGGQKFRGERIEPLLFDRALTEQSFAKRQF